MSRRHLLLAVLAAAALQAAAGSAEAGALAAAGADWLRRLVGVVGAAAPAAPAAAAPSQSPGAGVPGEVTPEAEALVDWIVRNGGEVNVAVRKLPGVGRATFAPREFLPGDVMARVPVELCYRPDDSLKVLQNAAVHLLADMAAPDSAWAPYFRALPGRGSVRSFYDLPRSYAPLIQDNATERAVFDAQDGLELMFQQREPELRQTLGPGVSVGGLKLAMSLMLTRLFQFENETLLLLPLIDMANHVTGCLHTHEPEPCDPAAGGARQPLAPSAGSGAYAAGQRSGQCIVWRARERVAAGSEVCNSYKFLFQDRTAIQYAFLQPDPIVSELSTMDRADYDPGNPWGDPPGASNPKHGPHRFEGTPEQLHAEVGRLTRRLAMLDGGDAAAAAVAADPDSDADGSLLGMLREWRRQRRAAIEREIVRVQRQAARLERAEAAAASGPSAFGATAAALTAWLEAQGAQVNAELRQAPLAGAESGGEAAGTCSTAGSCAAGQPAATSVGVFARRAVKAGDVIAAIPLPATFAVEPGMARLDTAVDVMLLTHEAALQRNSSGGGLSEAAARFAPFLASLPPLGSVRSLYNLPHEYLGLLAHADAEDYVLALQEALGEAWDRRRGDIEAADPSLSFAELQHAMSLIQTRAVAAGDGLLLVPLLEAARHNASCPHTDGVAPCPGDASGEQQCFVWVAGEDLQPGQEACTSYGWLLPDQGLLQFGLSLEQLAAAQPPAGGQPGGSGSDSGPRALGLSALDQPGGNPAAPFGQPGIEPPEPYHARSREEALAAVARLAATHLELSSPEAAEAAAALRPAARDADGALLAQLLAWRAQRTAAVEAEIERVGELWRLSPTEVARAMSELEQAPPAPVQAQPDGGGTPADWGEQAARAAAALDASATTDPWARLLEWLRAAGAMVNVDVLDTRGPAGRMLVARQHTQAGDLLAAIPVDLMFSVRYHGGAGSLDLAAANLWAAMTDEASPLRVYFASFPSREELLCPLVTMPREYRPLLQSDIVEANIDAYQAKLRAFWDEHEHDLTSKVPGMTLQDFHYARSLLATRLFSLGELGPAAVPLIDLSNHDPDCRNSYVSGPCPGNASRTCMLWQAGSYLAPGAEVCNVYKHMTNDRALLQYGFLQSGRIARFLHSLDLREFNESNLWQLHQHTLHGPPLFNGTREELEAEAARLKAIGAKLASGDAAAAAMQPAPSDHGGRLLALLREWRQQRQQVLAAEVARLEAQLAAGPEHNKQPPEDRLLEWLREGGAEVSGLRISTAEGGGAARRTVVAARRIQRGELMAAIPFDLGWAPPADLAGLPSMWVEANHPRSPRAPFWALLPGHRDLAALLSYAKLPLAYAPVIQHAPTEAYLRDLHRRLEAFAEESSEQLASASAAVGTDLTVDLLRHLLALVAARALEFTVQGPHLLPLLDLAPLDNACPHTLDVRDCAAPAAAGSDGGGAAPHRPPRPCAVWVAGADVGAGAGVCLPRGHVVLPDRAVLQHGLVLESLEPPLSGIDRHDFAARAEGGLPWQFHAEQAQFSGSAAELEAEAARLEARQRELAAGDAAAAAVAPAEGDPGGVALEKLRAWRRLRQAAVARELVRLRGALAEAKAG